MKVFVYILALVAGAFALPGAAQNQIKHKSVSVEPDGPPLKSNSVASRIIGGTEVVHNTVPYQVAIISDSNQFCGGSLISDQWVLTAAHCISDARSVQVILGAHRVFELEVYQQVFTSSNFTIHPLWGQDHLFNDIALVALPVAAGLTVAVQPIDLAPSSAGLFEGQVGLLTGWGRTENSTSVVEALQHVFVDIIENQDCALSFGSAIDSTHLCSSGAGIVGACNGDSGSPLVVNEVQVGIVSFGASHCAMGYPTVYTRVSSFREWVRGVTHV